MTRKPRLMAWIVVIGYTACTASLVVAIRIISRPQRTPADSGADDSSADSREAS